MNKILTVLVAVCLTTAVLADWNEGDGHKMHFPQLPDPTGWDVDFTRTFVADDWLCTQSGPVDDIHFWLSWRGGVPGGVDQVWVRIWPDIPDPDGTGPAYSMPDKSGEPLFDRIFQNTDLTIRLLQDFGPQGWYSPYADEMVAPPDHFDAFQVNIDPIPDPFIQEEGTIYWLELHVVPQQQDTFAGWKTTQDHFNDDAVWQDTDGNSIELYDPLAQPPVSLDMAFVITPEPMSLGLLAVGGAAMLRRRR